MFSVSILEARTIIRTIYKTYGTDLSGLAMASFRLRLSEILETHDIKLPEDLVAILLEDPEFYETFIRDVSIGSSDMFRDPDLWIDIRDRILPFLLKSFRFLLIYSGKRKKNLTLYPNTFLFDLSDA